MDPRRWHAQSAIAGAQERMLPAIRLSISDQAARCSNDLTKLAQEQPGQTLQATALVHEAYLRPIDVEWPQSWDSRGHFFAAAAEAMRRILIEQARRKQSDKRGGDWQRVALNDELMLSLPDGKPAVDLLALDDALREFELAEPNKAQLVKLRYFAGLSLEEAALALGISLATAKRRWTYARSWLYGKLHAE